MEKININSINFKAKYLSNPAIKVRQPNGRYRVKNAALVKISNTKNDANSLKNLSDLWDYGPNFIQSMLIDYYYRTDYEDKAVYVLTEQNKDFRKLNPKNILGFVEITKEEKLNHYKINYLQARPDSVKSKKKRPFKGIGNALMEYIINHYKDKKIYLNSVDEAINFYKKLGFKMVHEDVTDPLMMIDMTK